MFRNHDGPGHIPIKRKVPLGLTSLQLRQVLRAFMYLFCIVGILFSILLCILSPFSKPQLRLQPITPTPTPSVTPSQVSDEAQQYFDYVVQHHYESAYGMLSLSQQRHIPFDSFIVDQSYVLLPGCWWWLGSTQPSLESDGKTWRVGLMLAYDPNDASSEVLYNWEFQFRVEEGALLIVGIGLIGVGVGKRTHPRCSLRMQP